MGTYDDSEENEMKTQSRRYQTLPVLVISLLLLLLTVTAFPQSENKTSSPKTQIVMLGTGTPGWDPDRSGPATAIVVNGTPYLIDFGPGVVRRAGAAYEKGVKALWPPNIRVVFLTHLHADHTAGYSDLIYTPNEWRKQPLEVYGPEGIRHMTEHIIQAYTVRRPLSKRSLPDVQVNVHEIKPGVVYKDENITVKAFLVDHGENLAYGYRFETPDRTIVISGDTRPSQSIIDNCNGCDVLIHEAYSMMTQNYVSPESQKVRKIHHSSSLELAEIAAKAKPGLLILYHRSNIGGAGRPNPEEILLEEIRKTYHGKVVTGHDLDIF